MYVRNKFSPVHTFNLLLQSQKTKAPQISSTEIFFSLFSLLNRKYDCAPSESKFPNYLVNPIIPNLTKNRIELTKSTWFVFLLFKWSPALHVCPVPSYRVFWSLEVKAVFPFVKLTVDSLTDCVLALDWSFLWYHAHGGSLKYYYKWNLNIFYDFTASYVISNW